MLTVSCPNCGAAVTFRSAALPSRVCDYCQTVLVRRGDGVEAVGKSANLPFDVSPIQIGTTGRFDGHPFEVIGRVRWGWTVPSEEREAGPWGSRDPAAAEVSPAPAAPLDGSWNEWLLLFGDGSHAWLGEAMGTFMLTRERPLGDLRSPAVNAIAEGQDVPIGTEGEVDGGALSVADARAATCLAAEGELPFAAPVGLTIFSVDFRSPSGVCASLQREDGMPSLYYGRYVTLGELEPRNLRAFEGWPMPAFAA